MGQPCNRQERRLFDRLVDQVLAELPDSLHRLLEELPLIVEDRPSPEIIEALGLEDPSDLCGLHDGIPLPEKNQDRAFDLPDYLLIYREGILDLTWETCGSLDPGELRRQIRITILHEIGHHFGMTEDDLARLGLS